VTATGEIAAVMSREDRFTVLVERQSRFVYRVAYSVVRNAHDAEDVVQETFLKLYRLGAWEAMADERAFLARVAWRMAVDRRSRGPNVALESPWGLNPDLNPEEMAVASDRSAMVHRMMDALPEELRQPLALSSVDEMNSREIAEVMGIPEGTVRTRLVRARQVLREKLARHFL
jgi:RNA polymerase sigma-70 factor (ECF subfamily)